MKKGLIVAGMILVAILMFCAGFIAGRTQQAKAAFSSGIWADSVLLKDIDAGRTDHARSFLETHLMAHLDWYDAVSTRYFYVGLLDGPSGQWWASDLQWATARVKPQRDKRNYYLQHPEELSREFEKVVEKVMSESGKPDVKAHVVEATGSIVKVELNGFFPQRKVEQPVGAAGTPSAQP